MADASVEGTATAPEVVPRVLVFFDYACQFCYLDWPRFKRLRAEHGVDLFLVPFELRPELPGQGAPIESIGPPHSERVREHMHRMAKEGSLALVHPDFVPNTHASLVLGELARDLGEAVHEAVHEAVFSAYSGQGADIGDTDVLRRLATDAGIDAEEFSAALDGGVYDERLHQFRHLAMGLGISATPSAVICNELLIGSRPYAVLEESLAHCLVDADTAGEREGEPPSIRV